MQFLRRQLPIIVAFAFGVGLWVQYYVPTRLSQDAFETFTSSWAIILAGAALILGILSAVHHHWTKVLLKRPGYGYSLITLSFFALYVLIGWFNRDEGIHIGNRIISWQQTAAAALLILGILLGVVYLLQSRKGNRSKSVLLTAAFLSAIGVLGLVFVVPMSTTAFTAGTIHDESFFDWVFQNMFVPLDATMFSLLAFFIASAAFRAFRARSFEATALLIAGCIVMLGRVPVGELIGSPHTDTVLGSITSWILLNPSNAAYRGIMFGVILSQVAISLRIIFGIERTYMGGGE